MKMVQISVILPTYNRACSLQRSMQSVVSQTRMPGEVIVVDDGSTDKTAELVASFRQTAETEIIYLPQSNLGAAAARNAGIRQARFPFLAFLDSDDFWQKDKLAVQTECMVENKEFLVSHTQETWYRNGTYLNQKKRHAKKGGNLFARSLKLCVVGMSTVMVRREFFDRVGLFNESLPCCEDYDLWLRASVKLDFLFVDRPLTIKHGGREDQLSVRYRKGMDRYRIRALCDLLQHGQLCAVQRDLVYKALREKCMIYGNGCIKHGRPEEGGRYLGLPDLLTAGEAPMPC